jgi:hypothetical protein
VSGGYVGRAVCSNPPLHPAVRTCYTPEHSLPPWQGFSILKAPLNIIIALSPTQTKEVSRVKAGHRGCVKQPKRPTLPRSTQPSLSPTLLNRESPLSIIIALSPTQTKGDSGDVAVQEEERGDQGGEEEGTLVEG